MESSAMRPSGALEEITGPHKHQSDDLLTLTWPR
jgi:hypothetical protein